MTIERVDYKCPKCWHMKFFNKAEEYSTICPECGTEMLYMGSEFVSAEEYAKWQEEYQQFLQELEEEKKGNVKTAPNCAIVHCPYCNSVNTEKISTASKVANTLLFGVFGTKRHKQFHCNSCGADF